MNRFLKRLTKDLRILKRLTSYLVRRSPPKKSPSVKAHS